MFFLFRHITGAKTADIKQIGDLSTTTTNIEPEALVAEVKRVL